ncbi:MAG TPA: hypothetical protein VJB35_04640 [Candidatus Nanoarchaeia archaeon]|nr:hypothetical protein [Candidatus Nanoarchaeia archaeon]
MVNIDFSMFRYKNGLFRPDVKKKVLLIEDKLEKNFPDSAFLSPRKDYSFLDEDNFILLLYQHDEYKKEIYSFLFNPDLVNLLPDYMLSMNENDYQLIEDLLKIQINPSSKLKNTDGLFKEIEIPYIDFFYFPFG